VVSTSSHVSLQMSSSRDSSQISSLRLAFHIAIPFIYRTSYTIDKNWYRIYKESGVSRMQRWLLALLGCFYASTLFAQINVSVEIRGISSELEANARLYLSIEQQKSQELMTVERLHLLHKKAPLEISKALEPYGYYRAVIKKELSQPSPGKWQAIYTIDPGPPLLVSEFDFVVSEEMSKDPAFEILLKDLLFHKGDTFNHLKYENIKSSLAKLASERGYFKARFTKHHVEVDLEAYEARIHLHYDGGPRYLFGDVLIDQDVLNTELLKRYITFEKGFPYSLNKLIDYQHGLNDSDYFRRVEVSPGQPQDESKEIPINVKLTPRKRHRYGLGLGYGTDTGARAKVSWEIPRINKKGHRLKNEAKVAENGYSVSTDYRVPVLNPRTDQLVYSAAIVNEVTDTNESTIRTIGASLNRSRGFWRETTSLNYQQEKYIIADISGVSDLLMPGVTWSRTWGSNFIYAVDGLRFDISMRGATEKLLSDTDFFQLHGGIKSISSLGKHNRVILRGKLGSIWTDEFQQLPSSVRFFAGGGQSVRGYAYESLGPVDANGKVIGGRYLMVGSVELEHSFGEQWGAAIFYDAGNAIDDLDDKLERGAGFGFRWKSPIGPVRIDIANAISRDDHPWRLHINIGPDL